MADKTEILLAAYLLARPDLLPAVRIDPAKIDNYTARAVIQVLQSEGPAFAAPGPMIAALNELPSGAGDYNTLQEIFVLQPADVELAEIARIWEEVERASVDRSLIADIQRQLLYIERGGTPEEVARRLEDALTRYQTSRIGFDHTAPGILSRLKDAPPKIRWQAGIPELDRLFPGIGPDGQPGYGMLAQKEVTVLAAQYKAGKTRETLNWVHRLLDQGASVALIVLEDDEGSYALKLMAAKFRVPKHVLEKYINGGIGFLGDDATELAARCDEAISWLERVGSRLRIYDGASRNDIFNFERALELIALDKALHATTHVVIDYVQAWGGKYEQMAGYAFGLRALAAKLDVSVIEVSQVSNETIKFGSSRGQLAAKGAGEWGQAAHVGLELVRDPEVGDREIALVLKIARDAPPATVYVHYNLPTGTALGYLATPDYFPLQPPGGKSKLTKR